ncbi:CRTAC1 family protein [Micromonospora sonneratiae]|uniref:FG-GAP repeat domain-containing protein n=1 Tax=Micromonospora sonneratiae TaxID=1184706 RepID=A0ABW3YL59_9ACTN
MSVPPALRRILPAALAVLLCTTIGLATRLPTADAQHRQSLADDFSFDVSALNGELTGSRTTRVVQPALEHIRSWISSVGASVALADLDGDGMPNEACLVDPRDDSVTIRPTTDRPDRFTAFALTPSGVPYQPATTSPMGCAIADLNEDGHLDVLAYFWGRPPLAYLRRPGVPLTTSAFLSVDVADPAEIWNSTTLNVADLDGDGRLDILVGNYFPDGARVLDATARDDSRMQMQDSMSLARNAGGNRILRLTGVTSDTEVARPRFQDVSDALPDRLANGWTLATGAQDLDGDGLPELYVANDFGPDHLLHNRSQPGTIRFEELRGTRDASLPKSKRIGADSFKGMGVTFSDLNRDQRPDILVSNITTPFALEESNFAFLSTGTAPISGAVAPYRDESQRLGLARTGWGWDIKTADFNGDGEDEIVQALGFIKGETNRWAELQELAMGNDELLRHPLAWPVFSDGTDIAGHQRNPFFVREKSGRYVDISAELGYRQGGVTRGLAIADVDHDGRPDLAVANQWSRSDFLHNTGRQRTYLGIRPVLPATVTGGQPRPAVGASVEVRTPAGRVLTAQLYPGNGHTGGNAPELLFGLDDTAPTGPLAVTVRWRDAAGLHVMTTTLRPGWHTLPLVPQATR